MNGINDILQRSRELAVQAANGTLSDSDRATINHEYLQLREEIDRIALSTQAFDKYMLAPSTPPSYDTPLGDIKSIRSIEYPDDTFFDSGVVPLAFIPAGSTNVTLTTDALGRDDDIQLFSRDGKHLVGTPVNAPDTDHVWEVNGVTDGAKLASEIFTEENGFPAGVQYDDSALLENKTGYDAAAGVTGTYHGMMFTYSGDGDGDRFDRVPNDGRNTRSNIERVFIDNQAQQQVNTAAARSRIEDADYAQEASQLAKSQILQQASTSLLAQANQLSQNVLSLLT